MKENKTIENVVIIGGGPAGLSAGIYLARAGLAPIIFAGSPPGGQLTLTSEVENYPGYESIMGPELVDRMRKQAIKFGAKIRDENVKMIEVGAGISPPVQELIRSPFKVGAGISPPVQSKSLIIATGAKALWLGVPGEERLRGKGVSACATCDGFFFRNKVVAVVGGGDTALEEALTLTKFAKHVVIIHRKGEFRASKIMQKRVLEHPHIHELFNAQVLEIQGEAKIASVVVKITPSNQELMKKSIEELEKVAPALLQMKITKKEGNSLIGIIPFDGLFVAIGHKPDTDIFKGKVALDSKGYVITTARLGHELIKSKITMSNNQSPISNNQASISKKLDIDNWELEFGNWSLDIGNYQTSTSVNGIFAVGDCVDHVYRQAATAVGMGVGGALDVERWLEDK